MHFATCSVALKSNSSSFLNEKLESSASYGLLEVSPIASDKAKYNTWGLLIHNVGSLYDDVLLTFHSVKF